MSVSEIQGIIKQAKTDFGCEQDPTVKVEYFLQGKLNFEFNQTFEEESEILKQPSEYGSILEAVIAILDLSQTQITLNENYVTTSYDRQ